MMQWILIDYTIRCSNSIKDPPSIFVPYGIVVTLPQTKMISREDLSPVVQGAIFQRGLVIGNGYTVKSLIQGAPNDKAKMILVLSCSWLCPLHWSQVLSREWRCSWSSADRQCSNYIWATNSLLPTKVRLILEDLQCFYSPPSYQLGTFLPMGIS